MSDCLMALVIGAFLLGLIVWYWRTMILGDGDE